MRRQRPLPDRVATVGASDDPVRLALLEVAGGSETLLSRDQAVQLLGGSTDEYRGRLWVTR